MHPLVKEIKLLRSNRHYRVGDVVFQRGYYWKVSLNNVENEDEFEGTILRELTENVPKVFLEYRFFGLRRLINQFKVKKMKQILVKRVKTQNESLADRYGKELVIHIRAGDAVELDWYLEKDYETIIKSHIDNFAISRCTFCVAFHYGDYADRNLWIYTDAKHRENIDRLSALFQSLESRFNNLIFSVQSSEDVDEDFVYMYDADYFVRDRGGFSELIELCREL